MKTVIISLNSVNQFILVMVKYCVFFAIRTEFLNIIQTSFDFNKIIIFRKFEVNIELETRRFNGS
jgi:hypothetical protein